MDFLPGRTKNYKNTYGISKAFDAAAAENKPSDCAPVFVRSIPTTPFPKLIITENPKKIKKALNKLTFREAPRSVCIFSRFRDTDAFPYPKAR